MLQEACLYMLTPSSKISAILVLKYSSQPNDILQVIGARPMPNVPLEGHPMACLDALHLQILSKVPIKVRRDTRKLLLALAPGGFDSDGRNFMVLFNWLDMTCDEANATIRHLSSVLEVPRRDIAHMDELRYIHKSSLEYIFDFSCSEFPQYITYEAWH
jgi:hypothetical protein